MIDMLGLKFGMMVYEYGLEWMPHLHKRKIEKTVIKTDKNKTKIKIIIKMLTITSEMIKINNLGINDSNLSKIVNDKN
jgi:hypothetical protein